MSAGRRPNEAFDLRVLIDKAELERIGSVVDDKDLVKTLTHKVYHLLLTVVELQVMVARVPVVARVQGVVVGSGPVGRPILIGAVDDPLHVDRKVRAFAAGTGDHDHGGIRESLCVRNERLRVQADIGLRKCPVLDPHSDDRAVRLVVRIEPAQLLIGLDPRIREALQEADGVVDFVERAASASSEHGVGGCPAKHVQLIARRHRQDPVIFEEHRALLVNEDCELLCLCGSHLADRSPAAYKIQHGAHRSKADLVDEEHDPEKRRKKGSSAEQFSLRPGQFPRQDLNEDRGDDNSSDRD